MNFRQLNVLLKTRGFWTKTLCWLLFLHLGFTFLPDLNHGPKVLHGMAPFDPGADPDNCPFCQFDEQAGTSLSQSVGPVLVHEVLTTVLEIPEEDILPSSANPRFFWARPPPSFL